MCGRGPNLSYLLDGLDQKVLIAENISPSCPAIDLPDYYHLDHLTSVLFFTFSSKK
jgi:hypothetical protein